MSDEGFQYVPCVTTQPGDREELVLEYWELFREYNREFAALRAAYTSRTPKPGRHDRCTQVPLTFARIERRDRDGRLIGSEMWRNLLSPTWWGDGRNAHVGPGFTRPAFFAAEILADNHSS